MKINRKVLIAAVLALFLAACSKGGDGVSSPPPASGSDWDTLVWDQDNWS